MPIFLDAKKYVVEKYGISEELIWQLIKGGKIRTCVKETWDRHFSGPRFLFTSEIEIFYREMQEKLFSEFFRTNPDGDVEVARQWTNERIFQRLIELIDIEASSLDTILTAKSFTPPTDSNKSTARVAATKAAVNAKKAMAKERRKEANRWMMKAMGEIQKKAKEQGRPLQKQEVINIARKCGAPKEMKKDSRIFREFWGNLPDDVVDHRNRAEKIFAIT